MEMNARYYAYISVLETDYARPEVRALFDKQFPDEDFKPNVEDGIVTFEYDQDYYGRFSELENSLAALDVAFDRKSPGYDKFSEMLIQYRPGEGWGVYPLLEGEYVIQVSYVREMKGSMTAEAFLTWLDSLPKPSPLKKD